jgi:hypothetical protein
MVVFGNVDPSSSTIRELVHTLNTDQRYINKTRITSALYDLSYFKNTCHTYTLKIIQKERQQCFLLMFFSWGDIFKQHARKEHKSNIKKLKHSIICHNYNANHKLIILSKVEK